MPGVGVRAGAGPGEEAEGGVALASWRAAGRGLDPGRAGRESSEGLIPRRVGPSSLWQRLRNARATLNADQRGFADLSLEYPDYPHPTPEAASFAGSVTSNVKSQA